MHTGHNTIANNTIAPKMTSGVQLVTKSPPVVVVPSSSGPAPLTAGETVSLSPFDRCVTPFPVTMLLAFDRPIQEPAETIKSALSRALAHYRPIAGRLRLAGEGEEEHVPCIACTDEGITFVGASASCALEDVTAAQLTDLVIRYPGELCRDAEPLLLLQVTEFSCGGFAVGVTFNHVAADGSGLAQFLRSVGELARGAPRPSVAPVRRWNDGLPSLPVSTVAAQKSTMTHGRKDLARVDVVVPFGLIGAVKAESGGTVFDVVTAVLWRCRTRAIMSAADADPESPAPLAFPSDVRARVGAEAGYYGNCVVVQMVPVMTRAAVASAAIGDLVALIRRAKEKIPDLLLPAGASPDPNPSEEQGKPAFDDDAAAAGAGGTAVTAAEEGGGQEEMKLAYNALVVVNWRRLGVDEVDFGGGVPASVTWHEDRAVVPGCVACPPCSNTEDDGVRVAAICVKTEHAAAFLEELVSIGTRVLPSNLWA